MGQKRRRNRLDLNRDVFQSLSLMKSRMRYRQSFCEVEDAMKYLRFSLASLNLCVT